MITIPAALYSGSKTATANDANLVSANIKNGVTIFGVAGAANVVDTTAGTAATGDILTGKTAFVTGSLVTGSMSTQTLSNASAAVSAGYYAATTLNAVDADLAAGNIKSGENIFGVAGDPNVVDTSSGDAAAADILIDKKAWMDGSGITGTSYPAPVEATGETTSSDAGSDGKLKKGVAWPGTRFTDNGDGTVTDNLTGLIWLGNANCPTITRTWENALNDVAELNSDGTMKGYTCGDSSNASSHQTDWRLPNRNELNSLVDVSQVGPALPSGHPFSGVQTDKYYWTSTTFAKSSTLAWFVDIDTGYMNITSKPSGPSYVWPVRGGQ
ncbi:MAG: DUF1566 domain-containing protein [Gammaproteobacteria bacterium]|nr:DUF1566 domain-containing protein [Gammaproteobacteria bacterium]